MRKRVFSAAMFILLVTSMLTLVLDIQPVRAQGTIYIRADGSIDPPTANVTTSDNSTYTFAGNITDSIVVQRNNIVVDGAGYTLQGDWSVASGFDCSGTVNVTIKNTNIRNFADGITLVSSSNNTVFANNITENNGDGVRLESSSSNSIVGNEIATSWNGIHLSSSINNTIIGNKFTGNFYSYAVYFEQSSNNSIAKNNITDNYGGIRFEDSSYNNVTGNNVTNNQYGILPSLSSNNIISENNITTNTYIGVYLFGAAYNVFRNNSMVNNGFNFEIFGGGYSGAYVEDLDESNTVDGKPVYYWVNRQNMRIPSDAGFVALVDSYNITAEGLGLTRNGPGIVLSNTTGSYVTNNNITANAWYGVHLDVSSNNSITENSMRSNDCGVKLFMSSNNSIARNEITANILCGIDLAFSFDNSIVGNNVVANAEGVRLYESSGNELHWNNFDNPVQVNTYAIGVDVWDSGYPSGGNYWGESTIPDSFSGFFQNETGSDGIGDTLYDIDTINRDRYPLMNPWTLGSPRTCFRYSPEFPTTGEITTFDASASYAYQGSITSYEWNFGDGNTTILVGSVIAHVYTTEGVYQVNLTATDSEGLSHSITKPVSVRVDSAPPATVHDYDDLWHTTDFTVTLTATDDLTGVAETHYRINDGAIQNVTTDGQPPITTEGADNKLEYWSIDNAGNEESHHILTGIKLDKTAPTIETPSREPAGDVQPSQSVGVSVNVTDFFSHVEDVALHYSLDNETTWEQPLLLILNPSTNLYEATIPGQPAGTWVKYRLVAYDYAGNNATLEGTQPYCVYQVVPEFQSFLILPLSMIAELVAAIICRKKQKTAVNGTLG